MSIFRTGVTRIFQQAARAFRPQYRNIHPLWIIHEPVEELNYRYECFFCRADIDGWDIRQAMNDIAGFDLIPDPRITIAALYACRRVNDYALAVRWLETVKNKCGPYVDKIYPYIIQEITPTLIELGIETPECMGYDKPEFYLLDVDFIQYECFFCRADIDGWDIRQAMNDIAGFDLIPDPRITIAALYACRRVNDYALAVRWLETVKNKCGPYVDKIYPYIIQEITPTLIELGIETPECMGYDKPEFYLLDVDFIQ